MLSLMWGVLNGFLHGTAMLGAAGVDATTYVPLAEKGIATVAEWLAVYARQIDDGDYEAVDGTIETHLGAMRHVVAESESLGVDADLPKFVKAVAERAVRDGYGGSGYAALIERFRARAAIGA